MRGSILFVIMLLFSGCLGGPPGTEEAQEAAPETPVAESTPEVWQSAPLVVGHMEFSMDGGPWVKEAVFHWSHNVTAEDTTTLQRLPGSTEHTLGLRFVTEDQRNLTGSWSISALYHPGNTKTFEMGRETFFQVTAPASAWVGLHLMLDQHSVSWFGQRADLSMEWIVEGILAADPVVGAPGASTHRFLVPVGPQMGTSLETSVTEPAQLPFGRHVGLAVKEPHGQFRCQGGQMGDLTQDDTSQYLEIESWSLGLREVWVGRLPQGCPNSNTGNLEPVSYRLKVYSGAVPW